MTAYPIYVRPRLPTIRRISKPSVKGLLAKALWQIAVGRIIYVDAFQEVVGCFSRSNFIPKYPI